MKKIAFDAGHGINTAGKRTPDGIKEWTLNDAVRDKVVAILADYDCEIIHTDNNEGSVDEALSKRLSTYVSAGADAFVSIHHNAYTGDWNGATGVEVYVDKTCTAEDLELAKSIYHRMVDNTGLRGRGIKRANFVVINQNSIPAVLCEGGFMDGTNDYNVITSEAGQNAYAKAVAEGLIEFLKLEKKTSTTTPEKKSITEIAKEVMDGKWGNGAARKSALTKAGYDYATVQAKVNELSGKTTSAPKKKSITTIAKEVMDGKWGNGAARKSALTKAGYDYAKVQAKVNELSK